MSLSKVNNSEFPLKFDFGNFVGLSNNNPDGAGRERTLSMY